MLKKLLKKLARSVVIEAYWALDAHEEDNMAKQVILKLGVDPSITDDIVVAEVDRIAQSRGMSARRILRENLHGKS